MRTVSEAGSVIATTGAVIELGFANQAKGLRRFDDYLATGKPTSHLLKALPEVLGLDAATNAAKLYGIYPRKGTIAVGSDADIAIWDEQWERTISIGMLHDAMDYTPYEGMTVRGWPTHTISRGEVIWQDEQFLGEAGRGVFLPCEPPRPARPSGSALGLAGRELEG